MRVVGSCVCAVKRVAWFFKGTGLCVRDRLAVAVLQFDYIQLLRTQEKLVFDWLLSLTMLMPV